MDVRRVLILLLLGLSSALAVVREFHYVSLKKNWTEAQRYCREKFCDLATIGSAEEWARVSKMIENSGEVYTWLGLYDDVKSWRWSLGNTFLYEQELGSWFVLDEDRPVRRKHCATLYERRLQDCNCETALSFVCYQETSNSYIKVANVESWQSAQRYCRQTYTDLASIRNQQEFNDIMSVVDTNETYWVGLFRDGWKWSDQSDISFTKWGTDEPRGGEQTYAAATKGYWFGYYCETEYPFICSVAPSPVTVPQRKVLKVALKTDGSVNLNDPLVQEAVLKQVEKDLRGKGLHQEFSLRWKKQPNGVVFNRTEL